MKAALRQLRSNPGLVDRLGELSRYIRTGLTRRGLAFRESTTSDTPIIPLYTWDAENTLVKTKALYDAGVYVNPVLPPATPPNECLLRTSCMATHTEPLLDEAMDIIASVMAQ